MTTTKKSRVADVYAAVNAKAGPHLARPVSTIVSAVESETTTEDDARQELYELLSSNVLPKTTDPAEVRARLVDPGTRRYIEFYASTRPPLREEVDAILTGRGLDRVWGASQ